MSWVATRNTCLKSGVGPELGSALFALNFPKLSLTAPDFGDYREGTILIFFLLITLNLLILPSLKLLSWTGLILGGFSIFFNSRFNGAK